MALFRYTRDKCRLKLGSRPTVGYELVGLTMTIAFRGC